MKRTKRFDIYLSGRAGFRSYSPTLAGARKELRAVVAEELVRARRVSKQARKHKHSADNYTVTLGSSLQSALWTRVTLSTTL